MGVAPAGEGTAVAALTPLANAPPRDRLDVDLYKQNFEK